MSKAELQDMKQDVAPKPAAPKKPAAKKTAAKKPSRARADDQINHDQLDEAAARGAELGAASNQPGVDLTPMVAGIVGMFGNTICRRAEVAELSSEETTGIAAPLAKLISLYGVEPESEKGKAWFALCGCTMAVFLSRVKLPETIDGEMEPASEPVAPAGPSRPADKPGEKVTKGKDPKPENPNDPAPLVQEQSYANA